VFEKEVYFIRDPFQKPRFFPFIEDDRPICRGGLGMVAGSYRRTKKVAAATAPAYGLP
jgi:hypothetical protein